MAKRRWNQKSYAHKLVAELQIEMAHAVYDEIACKDNKFYREWKESEFVNMIAPTLRDEARKTLATMLTQPGLSDKERDEIYEALVLDNELPNEDRWQVPMTTSNLIH